MSLSEGDEADDLIASLNQQMSQHSQAVTLISTDKGRLLPVAGLGPSDP